MIVSLVVMRKLRVLEAEKLPKIAQVVNDGVGTHTLTCLMMEPCLEDRPPC